MRLRSLWVYFSLVLAGSVHGFAQQQQQQSGPRTLETLLNDDGATPTRRPAAVDATEPAAPAAVTAGRIQGAVARPKDGVQHPDLDEAWAEYDEQIQAAANRVKEIIVSEINAFAADGNLDGADIWDQARQQFEKQGQIPEGLPCRKATTSKHSAEQRLREVRERIKQAQGQLSEAYKAVEKAITKTHDFQKARQVRAEAGALLARDAEIARPKQWPKKGMYELVQSDRHCLLFEVGHDTIALWAYKWPGKPWDWKAKPQTVKFRVSDGILYADGVDEGTERLRWDITSNYVERDWYWAERRLRGTQKGAIAPSDLRKP